MTSPRPRIPTRIRLLPIGVVALLLLGTGAAAERDAGDFTGSWQFVGGQAEKREMRAAIEGSVADMTVVLRSLARKRLVKGSRIPRRVTIESGDAWVAIRDDQRRRLASPPGHITQTVSSTGDQIELLYEFQDGALVQYRTTPQGGRRTSYRIDPASQRLFVEVVTSSHYLPSPISYRLTYARVGAAPNTAAAD